MTRRNLLVFLASCLFVLMVACADDANQDEPIVDANQHDDVSLEEAATFMATVEETKGFMVTPLEGESELRSSDLISVGTRNAKLLDEAGNEIQLSDFKIGMTVEIVYDGMIMESYPAQMNSFQVQIVVDEE